jgi:SAM-dependent methyltransferase
MLPSLANNHSVQKLLEQHTDWLIGNDANDLYSNFADVSRVEGILRHTADVCGKVLEIGCFVGILSEKIINQGKKEVIGMDRLEKALDMANCRGIQPILGDLDNGIDLPDRSVDCVVAAQILECVYDPEAALEEIHRVLKPRGTLVIQVANLACLCNRLLMVLGRMPHCIAVQASGSAGQIRHYTFATLRAILQANGFEVCAMHSTIVAFPLDRFCISNLILRARKRLFPAPDRGGLWPPRFLFSKTLGRITPRLGEHIIVVAKKSSPDIHS